MLPRGRSSDWAHDGGIYRPVQLLITPKVFIESAAVDSDPDSSSAKPALDIAGDSAKRRDRLGRAHRLSQSIDEETGARGGQ